MLNCIKFSNLWLVSLDWKHYKCKNHETQSPTNPTSKDETEKPHPKLKKIIYDKL